MHEPCFCVCVYGCVFCETPESGTVYSWGKDIESGILGLENKSEETVYEPEVPMPLEYLNSVHIIAISAGSQHYLALSGNIFPSSSNNNFQLLRKLLQYIICMKTLIFLYFLLFFLLTVF